MFLVFGHKACGILAPRPGIEHAPPALEGKDLTTGLPGKSENFLLYILATLIDQHCFNITFGQLILESANTYFSLGSNIKYMH